MKPGEESGLLRVTFGNEEQRARNVTGEQYPFVPRARAR